MNKRMKTETTKNGEKKKINGKEKKEVQYKEARR